jgi:hypothetical protein
VTFSVLVEPVAASIRKLGGEPTSEFAFSTATGLE